MPARPLVIGADGLAEELPVAQEGAFRQQTGLGSAATADMDAFAAADHAHAVVTASADGFMSATDKVRLDGLGVKLHLAMSGGLSPALAANTTVEVTSALTAWWSEGRGTVPSADFNPTTGRWTATSAGRYRAEAAVAFEHAGADAEFSENTVSVVRNGDFAGVGNLLPVGATRTHRSTARTVIFFDLAAGDTLSMAVRAQNANVKLVNGFRGNFTVQRVS